MRLNSNKLLFILIICLLLSIVGCSNSSLDNDDEITEYETVDTYFTGKIQNFISEGDRAIVYGKHGGSEGEVIVNLTVNSEETFQVGDNVKVGYDGIIMESSPAKINTLSVELVE